MWYPHMRVSPRSHGSIRATVSCVELSSSDVESLARRRCRRCLAIREVLCLSCVPAGTCGVTTSTL